MSARAHVRTQEQLLAFHLRARRRTQYTCHAYNGAYVTLMTRRWAAAAEAQGSGEAGKQYYGSLVMCRRPRTDLLLIRKLGSIITPTIQIGHKPIHQCKSQFAVAGEGVGTSCFLSHMVKTVMELKKFRETRVNTVCPAHVLYPFGDIASKGSLLDLLRAMG